MLENPDMILLERSRSWLRLGRMHTAILETPIAVLGAVLGLGTLWHQEILIWVGFGLLYHWTGYSMNSWADYKKGFDKNDERKSHHPLPSGEISERAAKQVVYASLIVLFIYGLWASNFTIGGFIVIVIMFISGIFYNLYSKYLNHKYIPISIVHTTVFVLPYVTYSDDYLYLPFIFLTIAYFIHHVFQIGISGEVKDLDQDEANFLKHLGTTIFNVKNSEEKAVKFSREVWDFAGFITLLEFVSSYAAMTVLSFYLNPPVWIFIAVSMIFIICGIYMILEARAVITNGHFNREKRVSAMSRKELWGLFMIASAVIPVIGLIGWIAIVIISMMYFLPISKFMWGNWVKPEV